MIGIGQTLLPVLAAIHEAAVLFCLAETVPFDKEVYREWLKKAFEFGSMLSRNPDLWSQLKLTHLKLINERRGASRSLRRSRFEHAATLER